MPSYDNDIQHVMGHADKKKKDKPHTITPLERVNIECDMEAQE